MLFLKYLTSNHLLNVAVLSWFFAQLIKGILSLIENREFSFERFVGSGGMPSSHSAMVTSLVISSFYTFGFDSPVFALACCFAFVVIYDAANVRYQVGKQGELLNHLKEELSEDVGIRIERQFKEYVGHTKLEVAGGVFLGIAIAFLYRSLFLC